MKLVTVATHSERYYPYLKLSAERHGHELITLGWGEKWQGYAWKFKLMKEYLRTLSDEIVCFVDAFDVIVLEDPETIERKFIEIIGNDKTKMVISKEQFSQYPVENVISRMLQQFAFTKCKDEYINSGTYMGYSSTLLHVFDHIKITSPKENDQALIQEYCTTHEDQFMIDHECKIFLVINTRSIQEGEYNISYLGDQLKYNYTFPSFFHGNGYTDFDSIIKNLGYDTTIFKSIDNPSLFILYWNRFLEFIPYVKYKWWVLIVCILLLINIRKNKVFTRAFRVFS